MQKNKIESLSYDILTKAKTAQKLILDSFDKKDPEEIRKMLEEAHALLEEGERIREDLLFKEVNGKQIEPSLILIRSFDALSSSQIAYELAKKIVK